MTRLVQSMMLEITFDICYLAVFMPWCWIALTRYLQLFMYLTSTIHKALVMMTSLLCGSSVHGELILIQLQILWQYLSLHDLMCKVPGVIQIWENRFFILMFQNFSMLSLYFFSFNDYSESLFKHLNDLILFAGRFYNTFM